MKKTLLLLFILADVCSAQVAAPELLPPETQNHVLPPTMERYHWDTLASTWIYDLTFFINYTGNWATSDIAIDTITGTPIQVDTTVYDSLGRITDMWRQVWNLGWQNSSRYSHTYTDTSQTNRTSFLYAGNGANWTMIHGDSVYALFDLSGNEIDRYSWFYDMPSGIFKPSGRALTDYDLQNRVQRRRGFTYDTTMAQYKINQVDSNFQYDLVFTTLVTDMIQYNFTTGTQQPFYRQMVQYTGASSQEHSETDLEYNLNQQQWENLHRWTFTAQSCDNLDSAYLETWNIANQTWVLSSGTRDIFHWIDSCDYDELIFENYVPYLNIYRNDIKWVYPNPSTTGINEPNYAAEVSLFPNPMNSTATLEIKNEELKIVNCELRIYNTLGVVVRQDKISNLSSYILHRDGLRDGLYFYELRTLPNLRSAGQALNSELIGTGKFVIQ